MPTVPGPRKLPIKLLLGLLVLDGAAVLSLGFGLYLRASVPPGAPWSPLALSCLVLAAMLFGAGLFLAFKLLRRPS